MSFWDKKVHKKYAKNCKELQRTVGMTTCPQRTADDHRGPHMTTEETRDDCRGHRRDRSSSTVVVSLAHSARGSGGVAYFYYHKWCSIWDFKCTLDSVHCWLNVSSMCVLMTEDVSCICAPPHCPSSPSKINVYKNKCRWPEKIFCTVTK